VKEVTNWIYTIKALRMEITQDKKVPEIKMRRL